METRRLDKNHTKTTHSHRTVFSVALLWQSLANLFETSNIIKVMLLHYSHIWSNTEYGVYKIEPYYNLTL